MPTPIGRRVVYRTLRRLMQHPHPITMGPIDPTTNDLRTHSCFVRDRGPFVRVLQGRVVPSPRRFLFGFLADPSDAPAPTSFEFSAVLDVSSTTEWLARVSVGESNHPALTEDQSTTPPPAIDEVWDAVFPTGYHFVYLLRVVPTQYTRKVTEVRSAVSQSSSPFTSECL